MKVAFYKGKGGFLDYIVRLFTRGKYSHCELILPNEEYAYYIPAGKLRTKLFSADGITNKVRTTTLYLNEDNWDIIDVVTPFESKAIKFCEDEVGKEYDWLGILFFFIVKKEDPNKWFCSEICTKALQIGGLNLDVVPSKVSPNKLYKILKEV